MFEGFIPVSRASFMLDVVALAMFAVIPTMIWSIYLAKRGKFALHRKVNLGIAGLLLGAVTLFEIDIRLYGWRHLAEASAVYDTLVEPVLYVHLVFAIATTLLWIVTVAGALRRFKSQPEPGPYSPFHRRIAKLAALGMCGTAGTGWAFYIVAFML